MPFTVKLKNGTKKLKMEKNCSMLKLPTYHWYKLYHYDYVVEKNAVPLLIFFFLCIYTNNNNNNNNNSNNNNNNKLILPSGQKLLKILECMCQDHYKEAGKKFKKQS